MFRVTQGSDSKGGLSASTSCIFLPTRLPLRSGCPWERADETALEPTHKRSLFLKVTQSFPPGPVSGSSPPSIPPAYSLQCSLGVQVAPPPKYSNWTTLVSTPRSHGEWSSLLSRPSLVHRHSGFLLTTHARQGRFQGKEEGMREGHQEHELQPHASRSAHASSSAVKWRSHGPAN